MGAKKFVVIIGAAGLLITAVCSQAGDAVRSEPFDGLQSVTGSAGVPGVGSERRRLPSSDSQPPALTPPQADPSLRTPFGSPLPPNQLTQSPVLPFAPNRSLIPPPSTPVPYSGNGRFGR